MKLDLQKKWEIIIAQVISEQTPQITFYEILVGRNRDPETSMLFTSKKG